MFASNHDKDKRQEAVVLLRTTASCFISDSLSGKHCLYFPNDILRIGIEREDVVERILEDFDMDPKNSHIINGHMPVELKKGETPVKCNGKALIIDGGFSKAYRGKTGIAGYTLIYNSWGLRLVSHEPYHSMEEVVAKESDIHSEFIVVEQVSRRKKVADTDGGKILKEKINDLELLLEAYRDGTIRER